MTDANLHADYSTEQGTSRASLGLGALCARGAIAGLVAGFAFILANMWYAGAHGKPSVAPFRDISTVFGRAEPEQCAVRRRQPGDALRDVDGLRDRVRPGCRHLPVEAAAAGGRSRTGLRAGAVCRELPGHRRAFFPWFVKPQRPEPNLRGVDPPNRARAVPRTVLPHPPTGGPARLSLIPITSSRPFDATELT